MQGVEFEGDGPHIMTASSDGQSSGSTSECVSCGQSGQPLTGQNGGNNSNAAGVEGDVDVTQLGVPTFDQLLPANWTVDEVNTALLAINTLFLGIAVYYSYRGIDE